MIVSDAAKAAGVSRQAIYQAIKEGRLEAETAGGRLCVELDAVIAACDGCHVSRSGVVGVSWCERRQKWRVKWGGRIIFESVNKSACADVLERVKNNDWSWKRKRGLPRLVYQSKNGYYVQIRRGGEIVYRAAAATIADAIKKRDEFLENL